MASKAVFSRSRIDRVGVLTQPDRVGRLKASTACPSVESVFVQSTDEIIFSELHTAEVRPANPSSSSFRERTKDTEKVGIALSRIEVAKSSDIEQ